MLPMEHDDREINSPYAVYGNAAANDCLAGIDDGHVCRLIIGEGERSFVADHARLTDGRIAMATSKERRMLLESTEAELGYGVAKARAYVYLPFDYSLFATDLENPRFADAGIDPDDAVPISVAEPVTDGGQAPSDTECYPCDRCGEVFHSIELIPLEIPLTGEDWDLCDPCMDDLTEWIESDTDRSEGSNQ